MKGLEESKQELLMKEKEEGEEGKVMEEEEGGWFHLAAFSWKKSVSNCVKWEMEAGKVGEFKEWIKDSEKGNWDWVHGI